MPNKRILITTGGTGGHLYPAQALADQLQEVYSGLEILFAGGGLASSRHFDRSKYLFREIPCGKFSIKGSLQIVHGFITASQMLRKFQPDLVIGFGSYHTFPTLAATLLQRKPLILHEANCIPGKVNRLFSPYSKAIGVHFSSTASLLKGNPIHVGLPLRKGFTLNKPSREDAANYFRLDPKIQTVLIMGGSQGAKAINQAMVDASLHIKTRPLQIIHLTGSTVDVESIKKQYDRFGLKNYVHTYESRTEFAWALSDLAVTRAGASSLAEQISFSVPGILIPYPFAADNHQKENAMAIQREVGGVKVMNQEILNGNRLANEIDTMLANSLTFSTKTKQQFDFCSLICQWIRS